jgi:imidazole glycerol phosphate synthase glutamine amidotransferase subunit
MATEVLIARTGTANLASVIAGLRRIGASPRVTEDADEVRTAPRVVLPGVGAFGAAMEKLRASGLDAALAERIRAGRPTLAVCLGLQLLCDASDETPGVAGLSVVPGRITRFPDTVRVPQLGWNYVQSDGGSPLLESGYAYFANSYKLAAPPAGWSAAYSDHGGQFVAALARGAVLACQFHPELSGVWGLGWLRRWVEAGDGATAGGGVTTPTVRSVPLASAAAPVRSGASHYPARGETVRIIPCLDVRDGRVVKGVRFAGLRDAGSPPELAAMYEMQGADELVVLDVSATPEGRATAVETVRQVRAQLSIPLTVGGGVRSIDNARALLEAGADKVGVNTAAVRDPGVLDELARQFGRQCTVLALDAARTPAGNWEVVVTSGTERTGIDAVQWAREATRRGAGEILLTSWDRDGTRSGYDEELTAAVARAVSVPVIASGGAAGPEHLLSVLRAGADAVLAASIFHYGEMTVRDVKEYLAARGVAVRQ